MRRKASRIAGLALMVAAAGFLAPTPGRANCGASAAIYVGVFTGLGFQGCGDTAVYSYYWAHQRGVQAYLGNNATLSGAWGNDSGPLSGTTMGVYPSGAPGDYQMIWDWGNFGGDGCILTYLESDTNCATGYPQTLAPMDLVLVGYDAADPLVAKAAVLSVDGNEVFQFWALDQAGADVCYIGDPPVACVGGCENGYQFYPAYWTCGEIPVPRITSVAGCDDAGCTLNVTVGPHTVPIVNDCQVAASPALNCTGPAGDERNLYVGRQIFVKRAPCDGPLTIDTRTFMMAESPASGAALMSFVPYAPEDLNLNGVQDGAEAAHVPVILDGNDFQTVPVFIPKIADATDCAYLGAGLRLDASPQAGFEEVVTPLVSANPIPFYLGTATPAADRVINLNASSARGQASVSWQTTAELSTAGFNLIGVKRNGTQIQMNEAMIPAEYGTTGEGASYSIDLGMRDLKGATAVYVELVKTSGAKELFGPASF